MDGFHVLHKGSVSSTRERAFVTGILDLGSPVDLPDVSLEVAFVLHCSRAFGTLKAVLGGTVHVGSVALWGCDLRCCEQLASVT